MKAIEKILSFIDALPDVVVRCFIAAMIGLLCFWMGNVHGSHKTAVKYQTQLNAINDSIKAVNSAHTFAAGEQLRESRLVLADIKTLLADAREQNVRTQTIIKEVPKYVTKQADAQCVVPDGFVWLHDASLAGEIPDISGRVPRDVDAPSGIALSGVAEVSGSNNAECVERGKVILAWQRWYTENKAIFERASRLIEEMSKK